MAGQKKTKGGMSWQEENERRNAMTGQKEECHDWTENG